MSPAYSRTPKSPYSLLSHLWLHEPNADIIARATAELDLPAVASTALALAYSDLFLLNVYPYGTVFTDPSAELNSVDAQRLASLYDTHDYQPDELSSVGAADHLGLCLGFLSHLLERGLEVESTDFAASLLAWAPICCLAVEREPVTHSFYRALAAVTRETLFALEHDAQIGNPQPQLANLLDLHSAISDPQSADGEIRLRDVVRFLLAPARCGVFLSRSRLGQLARELGLRLPIGSRFEVAEMLFGAAGESELIDQLLTLLQTEVEAWAAEYRRWVEVYPRWRSVAEAWSARAAQSLRTLAEMRQIAALVST